MTHSLYKKILQLLFFLALLSPWIVDRKLFFPYVTGSAMFFRIVVEFLFATWIIYAVFFKKLRPKFNLLLSGVFVYILGLSLATFFSINPYLSFWGDAERMMGLFGLLHFFAFFLVGVSIFRERDELLKVLKIFVVLSFSLSLYGIMQRLGFTSIKPGELRIVATMGNAAVFASYLIFGLGFSFYLSFADIKKDKYRLFYFISAFFHVVAIILTGTRGAWLGVVFGSFFASLVVFWHFRKHKKIARNILLAILALFLIYSSLFLFKDYSLVQNNKTLYRLTSFSLQDSTAITRFMSWKSGWNGFKERPLFGYGPENFSVSFNKHFDPDYYNYAAGQPYFDRAHNIIIELLSTTGLVGLLAYLFLLFTICFNIIKYYRRSRDYVFLSVIMGIFIAYFIQNLFVFDMLPSMLGFSVFLVFVNNWGSSPDNGELLAFKSFGLLKKFLILFFSGILIFLLGCSFYFLAYKPYLSLKENVLGQMLIEQDYAQGINYLKNSVSRDTYLDLDLRTVTANTIFNHYFYYGHERGERENDLDFAIGLYEENLKFLPTDVYYNYKLAELLNFRFSLNLDRVFVERARNYIDRAIAHSPTRARLYYISAENYLSLGELEKAVEEAGKAVTLNDKFGESHWELSKVYYLTQNYQDSRESLIHAIDAGHRLDDQSIFNFRGLFDLKENIDDQIIFYELFVKNKSRNYIYYSSLANLYYEKGDFEKAKQYALEALSLNPGIQESVEEFLQRLN